MAYCFYPSCCIPTLPFLRKVQARVKSSSLAAALSKRGIEVGCEVLSSVNPCLEAPCSHPVDFMTLNCCPVHLLLGLGCVCAGPGGPSSHHKADSCSKSTIYNHGITEWLGLEITLKIISFQPPSCALTAHSDCLQSPD